MALSADGGDANRSLTTRSSRSVAPEKNMRRTESHHDALVRLTVLDNEATARLAEQRLRQQGIPSFSRSLQGGPGLWGSAFNLPHALYVHPADEMRAREVLDLVPLEVVERDGPGSPPRRRSRWLVVALALLIAALLVITAAPLFIRLYG